ncbi:peptidyl-prolyl cis-trans isomerase [Motiliproteus coralliicola]|uniref:Peptidyl-prolyl cis-trans isomerase n=2 Tax=Motiliproteus coralliicola TaxID=2283196 RepID=A0A369WT65_9GAMM|nr:peptidyl-prolyl cis-trans isomerase [Motiliproteus coralliicola]
MGNIVIELNPEKAPKSVANFSAYVKSGYYDGVIFHRVINGFMIQGGGFTPSMSRKPTQAPIENEADNGLSNVTGSVALARTGDPHSATAQFFINVNDNVFLDHQSKTNQGWGYAVFGKVVEGMGVVNQIKQVSTTSKWGYRDVPAEPIVINKASLR